MSHNVPSIYDVATKGSNVPKGKGGKPTSVYAVLSVCAVPFHLLKYRDR